MFHAKLLRIRTERRTPIPAKTTVAGENACQVNMSVYRIGTCRLAYQANCASCLGESKKDVNGRIQPFCPSGLIWFLDLPLKDSKNIAGRIAVLELGGEWVQKEIVLCSFVINFQGIIDYYLKVGGGGGSRERHGCESRQFQVVLERKMVGDLGDRWAEGQRGHGDALPRLRVGTF
jgi:hypothetical protein